MKPRKIETTIFESNPSCASGPEAPCAALTEAECSSRAQSTACNFKVTFCGAGIKCPVNTKENFPRAKSNQM